MATSTVTKRLEDVHPQMLRVRGEAGPQLSGDDFKALIGRAVERAIVLAGMTKQQAAFAMGYTDSGVIGRWISGQETPQFARLWAVPELRIPMVQAFAEQCEQSAVEIRTVITLQQRLG